MNYTVKIQLESPITFELEVNVTLENFPVEKVFKAVLVVRAVPKHWENRAYVKVICLVEYGFLNEVSVPVIIRELEAAEKVNVTYVELVKAHV